MFRLLLADGSDDFKNSVATLCQKAGYCVAESTAENDTIIQKIEKQFYHIVIVPIETKEGLVIIQRLKQIRPSTSIIVTSRKLETDFIVDSIRYGASHFYYKGHELDKLLQIISQTVEKTLGVQQDNADFSSIFPTILAKHPKILEILELIYSIKDTDSTVLISGESGTGKEAVARSLHDLSVRKKFPWVAVNCSAIPATLIESELFGYARGAFTGAHQNKMGRFQMAGQGTLFLDEIAELPFELQSKLLRAIQSREFEAIGSRQSIQLNARIIAATNQDLEKAVVEKRFREDLFYRLNVIPIHIPPLRARKSDIPLLCRSFIQKFSQQNNKKIYGISQEAIEMLMNYHWPGNVRELENCMERAVVLKRVPGFIELCDLPLLHFRNLKVDRFVSQVTIPDDGIDFDEAVNDFENELIIQALHKTDGNKNKAAHLLHLNRTTLVEKLKRKKLCFGT